jgi:hypothetical protein
MLAFYIWIADKCDRGGSLRSLEKERARIGKIRARDSMSETIGPGMPGVAPLYRPGPPGQVADVG